MVYESGGAKVSDYMDWTWSLDGHGRRPVLQVFTPSQLLGLGWS